MEKSSGEVAVGKGLVWITGTAVVKIEFGWGLIEYWWGSVCWRPCVQVVVDGLGRTWLGIFADGLGVCEDPWSREWAREVVVHH